MTKDKEHNPSRRDFLAMTSMGAATLASSLAATGSAHAQDGKPQEESKEADGAPSKHLELLFLGTGAANWPRKYPFTDKNHSRAQVRAMSSMLVNGHILIDCGPTVLDVMKCYEVNPAGITDILLTHTHSDPKDATMAS